MAKKANKAKKPAQPRTAEEGSTTSRNRSLHAARKAGAVLEDSAGAPSRKSSRRSRGNAHVHWLLPPDTC